MKFFRRNYDDRRCGTGILEGDEHDVHLWGDGGHRRGAVKFAPTRGLKGPFDDRDLASSTDVGLHDSHHVSVHVDIQYSHYGHDGAHCRRRALTIGERRSFGVSKTPFLLLFCGLSRMTPFRMGKSVGPRCFLCESPFLLA